MSNQPRVVPVHKLFLDNNNPRHPPIENEGEIIGKLVTAEKVRGLAEDIVKFGISPLDRMGVVPHPKVPDAYIAVEGNRRLCALKLLLDPEKAPLEKDRKAFHALKNALPRQIKALEVVVFPDRDAARHWMSIRHEGEKKGAGTKSWKASQVTRFNAEGGQADSPNLLAQEVLDYAINRKIISPDEYDKTKITTLTRFLNGPVFRDALGITSNKALMTDAPQDEFDRGIERFLRDARTPGSEVNSRAKKEDRDKYHKKLVKEGFTPTTRSSQPVRLHPENGKMDSPPRNTAGKDRDNRSPDRRKNVIPTDFQCRIKDRVQKRVYDELKRVDAEESSFAAAYLLRAFIELTTRAYCKKFKLSAPKPDLHLSIGKAADHLQHAGVPAKELKALRVMAHERDSAYSPESLGAAVHGGLIPTRSELNRCWDTMELGLRHMLDRL